MRRFRSGTITVEVDAEVRIDDVLDQCDDEALEAEIKARGLKLPASVYPLLVEVQAELLCGRVQEAIVLLERIVRPKFLAEGVYEKARAIRDPASGRPVISW